LIGLARLALFALVFVGVLNASKNAFKPASLAASTGASLGSVRLTLGPIAAAAVALLVLTVMAGYPLRQRLPARTALALAAPAVLVGVAALALAYATGSRLGSAALGALLLPVVPFALSLLLAWGAPPRPQRSPRPGVGPSGDPDRSPGLTAPARQRRGGRKR
jgi:hypothetical protein